MFRKISANKIYPVSSSPLENAVIIIDENGKIITIDALENQDKTEIEFFNGVIVPGFINTHCHLELSHLHGVAPTGTGLMDFISQVIKNRNHASEIIQTAIQQEEQNMLQSGILFLLDFQEEQLPIGIILTFQDMDINPMKLFHRLNCRLHP